MKVIELKLSEHGNRLGIVPTGQMAFLEVATGGTTIFAAGAQWTVHEDYDRVKNNVEAEIDILGR